MSEYLDVHVEVAGCPTVCMHCWAQGVAYNAMALEEIRRVLQHARRYCDDAGLDLIAYPMHEVVMHPQAVEVIRLFQEFVFPEGRTSNVLPTTGVPIALREDWADLLDGLQECGVTCLWLAFHGTGAAHDRVVNRPGAYRETCLAVERARSRGLHVGANVFVTKENVRQVEELAEALARMRVEAFWDVALYSAVSRVRRYEGIRPELSDLAPIAEKVTAVSSLNAAFWTGLENYTEAAYTARVLRGGQEGFERHARSGFRTVCRNNLDLHAGVSRLYRRLHGNLGTEEPGQVFARAVAYGPVSDDDLHFPGRAIPTVQELANTVGDANGERIYPDLASMRWRWLDAAKGREHGDQWNTDDTDWTDRRGSEG